VKVVNFEFYPTRTLKYKMKITKPRIAITLGDINGIGLEVTLKVLKDTRVMNHFIPIIYASPKTVAYHKNIIEADELKFQTVSDASKAKPGRISVVNCWEETVTIQLGAVTKEGGEYAKRALEKAIEDIRSGYIDILVTAPIHKKSMELAEFGFPGHTEYLKDAFGVTDVMMMMVHPDMKISMATGHIPLSEVSGQITSDLIRKRILQTTRTMKKDFGIEKPVIAILGLNPHAGDEGVIGYEEQEIIRPVVIELKKKGSFVFGPFASDGFFGSLAYKKFDAILAIYHDQGLIPFKFLAFHEGVNFTAGLPVVRTSPDHGTAMDIAGKNLADPTSMRNAIYAAIDIWKNRSGAKTSKRSDKPSIEEMEKTLEG